MRLKERSKSSQDKEETHEQADDEEGEDLVSKAEAEFFKIVEAEKKALEEAENKRNAAFAEVKQAIAQEGVTHEEYQEGENEEKQSEATAADQSSEDAGSEEQTK
ncbi:Dynein intermediate chain 2, axonemal [Desmophyllum pertusum]|uniref:Dynein intermediate chain 2, axonemal n=1 Tax=Desmophyllum pertusum TaxID=174260 RepID=A0A9W9Z1D2_9CNID|nr:Dynein intermediate chain 2, axonemal [Desmophyllum pertusum]